MVHFHTLSGLANCFVTFGLKTEMKHIPHCHNNDDESTLKVYVDDFHKKTISDEDAHRIFDLVTEAFILGSKTEHHYCGATYTIDHENMTVVEHIDFENRGEWL